MRVLPWLWKIYVTTLPPGPGGPHLLREESGLCSFLHLKAVCGDPPPLAVAFFGEWFPSLRKILWDQRRQLLVLRCSFVECINIYVCYVFFDWSLDHYVVSFHISYNSLYFKVYFVWYEYYFYSFLLIFICVEFLILPTSLSVCLCLWIWSGSFVDSVYAVLCLVAHAWSRSVMSNSLQPHGL